MVGPDAGPSGTRTERIPNSGAEWFRTFWSDSVTLVLTSALIARFWCELFAIGNRAPVYALLFAATGDAFVRLNAACASRHRPVTFSQNRRTDLIGALLVGTGPWPISETGVAAVIRPLVMPEWLPALGSSAIVIFTMCRLAAWLGGAVDCDQRSMRGIATVPPYHVASLRILTSAGSL